MTDAEIDFLLVNNHDNKLKIERQSNNKHLKIILSTCSELTFWPNQEPQMGNTNNSSLRFGV